MVSRVLFVFFKLALSHQTVAESADDVAKDLSNPANARASMSSNLVFSPFGGSNDENFSTTTLQYFYDISLGDYWVLGTGPVASYNHEVESHDALTFLIGVGLSKTIIRGTKINKFAAAITYTAVRPDSFGPEWLLKLTWTAVTKNPVAGN